MKVTPENYDKLNQSLGPPEPATDPNIQPLDPPNLKFAVLNQLPGICIKQNPNYLQNICAVCQEANSYHVFSLQPGGKLPDFEHSAPILKCQEKSLCVQRYFLDGRSRAFELEITIYQPQIYSIALKVRRQYRFTCCIFMRPFMEVYTDEGYLLGTIHYPWMCCDKGVAVKDTNDQIIFSIIGSCCQWPFHMNLPCEMCQRAVFPVKDNDGQKYLCKKVITEQQKHTSGCPATCFSDATTFAIPFTEQVTPIQRALLLAASIFIDMNYFERSAQQR